MSRKMIYVVKTLLAFVALVNHIDLGIKMSLCLSFVVIHRLSKLPFGIHDHRAYFLGVAHVVCQEDLYDLFVTLIATNHLIKSLISHEFCCWPSHLFLLRNKICCTRIIRFSFVSSVKLFFCLQFAL